MSPSQSMNISAPLCLDASNVAASISFKVLIAIKMILAVLGSLCIFVLYKKKRSSWIPNPNARLLYYAHVYFAFHATTGFFVVYAFDLIRTSIVSEEPCHYVLNARFSCAFRLIPVLGAVSQSFNMFTFAIERAISTVFIEKYEKIASQKLGMILVIFSIVAACVMHYAWTYLPIPEDAYVASLTIRTPQNSTTYQIATFLPFCLEVATFTIFGVTYYLNVRKHSKLRFLQKLGHKYQVSENKFLIRALYPCFFTHFLLSAFTYIGIYLYPMFFPQFETVISAVWVECFSQSPNYALFMPWILMWQKKRRSRIENFQGNAVADDYFKRFNQLLKSS